MKVVEIDNIADKEVDLGMLYEYEDPSMPEIQHDDNKDNDIDKRNDQEKLDSSQDFFDKKSLLLYENSPLKQDEKIERIYYSKAIYNSEDNEKLYKMKSLQNQKTKIFTKQTSKSLFETPNTTKVDYTQRSYEEVHIRKITSRYENWRPIINDLLTELNDVKKFAKCVIQHYQEQAENNDNPRNVTANYKSCPLYQTAASIYTQAVHAKTKISKSFEIIDNQFDSYNKIVLSQIAELRQENIQLSKCLTKFKAEYHAKLSELQRNNIAQNIESNLEIPESPDAPSGTYYYPNKNLVGVQSASGRFKKCTSIITWVVTIGAVGGFGFIIGRLTL